MRRFRCLVGNEFFRHCERRCVNDAIAKTVGKYGEVLQQTRNAKIRIWIDPDCDVFTERKGRLNRPITQITMPGLTCSG